MSRCAARVLALALAGPASAATIDATWTGGAANDSWSDAANWDLGGGFPDNGVDTFRVFIDGGGAGASSVTLDVDVTIDELDLDVGDSLTLDTDRRLDVVTSTIVRDAALLRIGSNSTLAGGTLATQGSGEVRGTASTPAGTLQDVTSTARIRLLNGEGLVLAGAIDNSGEIVVESTNGAPTDLLISAAAPVTLSGTGTVRLASLVFSNRAFIAGSSPGATLTIASGAAQMLRGEGVVVDVVGGNLTTLTNNGTLDVAGDGAAIVQLVGIPLLANNQTLRVLDGGELRIGSETLLSGGTLSTEGDAEVRGTTGTPAGTLKDVMSSAQIRLTNGEGLELAGAIQNDGDILVESLNGAPTDLLISGGAPVTLSGTGTITLSSPAVANRALITGAAAGATLTIATGAVQTLRAEGRAADVVGGNLTTLTNDGTLEIAGDGTGILQLLTLPLVANNQTIRVLDAAILRVGASSRIAGGALSIEGTGEVRGTASNPAGALQDVAITGQVRLLNGEGMELAGTLQNDGEIRVESLTGAPTDLLISESLPVTLSGGGTLTLSSPFVADRAQILGLGPAATLTQTAGHRLRGTGFIGPPVQSGGLLSPGLPIGELEFDETLDLLADSRLDVDIAGFVPGTSHDHVSVNGDVTLGGIIVPSVDPSFAGSISPSDVFPVLQATNGGVMSGEFSGAPSGTRVYGPNGVSFLVVYGAAAQQANTVELTSFQQSEPGPLGAWAFSGTAAGGTIRFDVDGVAIVVTTLAGQTAEEVAQAVSDAIAFELDLFPLGIIASASGSNVLTNGDVSEVTISDPGLAHESTALFFGPAPYRCFDSADNGVGNGELPAVAGCGTDESPFATENFSPGYFHMEDFEDQSLDALGVTASFAGSFLDAAGADSVDEDDGALDGSGSNGRALYSVAPDGMASTGTFRFTFDPGVLPVLPTHAGIVWTDVDEGVGNVTFEVFDSSGVSLGAIGPVPVGDGATTGQTAEDRFFGAIHGGGISAIEVTMSQSQSFELDHLQYAFQVPPIPALPAGVLTALALLLLGATARRAGERSAPSRRGSHAVRR